MADARDRLLDRLLGNGGRFILEYREYPALGWALIQELLRLAPRMRPLRVELGAAAVRMGALAAGWDFSGASTAELEELMAADACVQLQADWFLPETLPFVVRCEFFLRALLAHDAGVLPLVDGDIGPYFLPSGFLNFFPALPKPLSTAAICVAAEAVGQRARCEAERRGQAHIGKYAADLLLGRQAVGIEAVDKAVETTTKITHSTIRKRGLKSAARALLNADGFQLHGRDRRELNRDLLRAETFEVIADLAADLDLIQLTTRAELLDVFPQRVADRIIDAVRHAMADKRSAKLVDVDELEPKDQPRATDAAEDRLEIARLRDAIRDRPERDQRILDMREEGLNASEIGEALGEKPETIRQALVRLRKEIPRG